MKTLAQYLRARFFDWRPEVGAIYAGDEEKQKDPFKRGEEPIRVRVLELKDGYVKYQYVQGETDIGEPRSSSVTSFASYWLKVK